MKWESREMWESWNPGIWNNYRIQWKVTEVTCSGVFFRGISCWYQGVLKLKSRNQELKSLKSNLLGTCFEIHLLQVGNLIWLEDFVTKCWNGWTDWKSIYLDVFGHLFWLTVWTSDELRMVMICLGGSVCIPRIVLKINPGHRKSRGHGHVRWVEHGPTFRVGSRSGEVAAAFQSCGIARNHESPFGHQWSRVGERSWWFFKIIHIKITGPWWSWMVGKSWDCWHMWTSKSGRNLMTKLEKRVAKRLARLRVFARTCQNPFVICS